MCHVCGDSGCSRRTLWSFSANFFLGVPLVMRSTARRSTMRLSRPGLADLHHCVSPVAQCHTLMRGTHMGRQARATSPCGQKRLSLISFLLHLPVCSAQPCGPCCLQLHPLPPPASAGRSSPVISHIPGHAMGVSYTQPQPCSEHTPCKSGTPTQTGVTRCCAVLCSLPPCLDSGWRVV